MDFKKTHDYCGLIMNLFVSRDGQTFGPYTMEQAKEYLDAGQLLPNDYALIEGQAVWKSLADLVATQASVTTPQPQEPEVQTIEQEKPKPQVSVKENKQEKKVRKIKGGAKVQTVYVAQKKGIVSKIFSTVMVFSFMMLLAVGGIVGAYFAMPEKLGPLLKKFGVPMDQLLAQTPVGDSAPQEKVSSEPKTAEEIALDAESFQTLRKSGIRILPLENEKGLQVIAPADPPMEDEELNSLMPIASHVVSLDLTNSKISDSGMDSILKLVNLKKLNLEGSTELSASGASKLRAMKKLEHLNLINVALEDSIVDALLDLESLREVYLYNCGVGEDAIQRLKTGRPKMFVNAG